MNVADSRRRGVPTMSHRPHVPVSVTLESAFVTKMRSVSGDPAVSSLDELDAEASILPVNVAILWHRRGLEVIERHEEPHRGATQQ